VTPGKLLRKAQNMDYQHIIVPLDGSETAECVLPHLEAVASKCQITTVELIRVVEPAVLRSTVGFSVSKQMEDTVNEDEVIEAEEYLSKVAARINLSNVNVITNILKGKPAEVLADYIKKNKTDLLLIATHGRSGPSRWFWGSVADKLLRSTCTPVLMIRAPGCPQN
jgi:nucleotide-binding universal stress UspA family protein